MCMAEVRVLVYEIEWFFGGEGGEGNGLLGRRLQVIWAQERKLRVNLSRVSSSFLHLAC